MMHLHQDHPFCVPCACALAAGSLALLAIAWRPSPTQSIETPRRIATIHNAVCPFGRGELHEPDSRGVAALRPPASAMNSDAEQAETDEERPASVWHVRDAGPATAGTLEAPFAPLANEKNLYVREIADSVMRVGLYRQDSGLHPVLLAPRQRAAPEVTLLDILHGGTWSVPLSVNGGGEAAGSVGLPGGGERPVRWLENGEAVEMDTLAGGRGRVNGINGEGQMVGWSLDGEGKVRATAWSLDGQPVDLNSHLPEESEWILEQAVCVTDAGAIYGLGRRDGAQRLFCMLPTDEDTAAGHLRCANR